MKTKSDLSKLVASQRAFFLSGATLPLRFRKEQLKKLYGLIDEHQQAIREAVKMDFRKPPFESFLSEEGFVLSEISFIRKRLRKWMKTRRLPSSLLNFPSSSYLHHEPYGLTLILSPWNYPFQLAINPLAGAIAAGNCAIIKPSEFAPATANIVSRIINDNFPEEFIQVVEGEAETAKYLLEEHFDYIFFTGSQKVGKIIAKTAAEQLIPVTLELGGKSPCIVDETADIRLAARRLAWGKCLNGGQTCIAPDYLYVHDSVKESLLSGIVKEWKRFYGENPKDSPDYPRIINEKQYSRLIELLDERKVYYGGEKDPMERYLSPTIIDNVTWEDPVMKEEIFGPVLPVLSYQNLDEILNIIKIKPRPLALYVFSTKGERVKNILTSLSFGGASVNDTIAHFGNPHIPFGGIGSSGYGAYHGRYSFETFSHKKGVLKKGNWLDIPLRYAPYHGKLKWLKLAYKYNIEW